MAERISEDEGRSLFGGNADAYHDARPDYPDEVYELLRERCGLTLNTATLEIGAGSGMVTSHLLNMGADPLVAVEPDPGFASRLNALQAGSGGCLEIVGMTFEEAELGDRDFMLVVCATSFHWLDRDRALPKLRQLLRPKGWLVAFWNVFGDPERHDPFQDATDEIMSPLALSPSHPSDPRRPAALDVDARRGDFESAGAGGRFQALRFEWKLTLDARGVRALYGTFSSVARLPDREREVLLDQIERVATEEFGGVVTRSMVTPVYLGQCRG